MTEPIFDHDRLDVYRLAVQYTAESFRVAKGLSGLHRHVRDQWLRAAPFIPLNVAEVNGKRSPNDRARFLDIARGSALECAAIQDVLVASGGLDAESSRSLKRKLQRIVSMLTRMAMKGDGVGESQAEYRELVDDEHEHRFAEHEHEQNIGAEPELVVLVLSRLRRCSCSSSRGPFDDRTDLRS
jgi:four helix bundle protein